MSSVFFNIYEDDDDEDSCSDTVTVIGDLPVDSYTENRQLLNQAIEEENLLQISYHLAFEPDPHVPILGKPSPLWMAIHNSTPEIVDVLIRSGYSIMEMQCPSTYYFHSDDYTYTGDLDSLSDYKGYTYFTYMTLLHWAVINDSYSKVKVLLAHGASPNWVDERGNSVLLYAVESGSVRIAEELIKQGAKVNEPLTKHPGNYLIHDAVHSGNFAMVKMLLNYGAKVNVINCDDQSVLHLLLKPKQKEMPDLVQLLADAGCPINYRQQDKFSPLYLAVEQRRTRTCRILLEHLADPNAGIYGTNAFPLVMACEYRCLSLIRHLLESGAYVDQRLDSRQTLLHVACTKGHAEVVRELLKYGADIDAIDNSHKTPLHAAVERGSKWIVRLLLRNGANAEVPDNEMYTPLHRATFLGLVDVVKILLEAEANMNTEDYWCFTPLHTACRKDKLQVVKILVKMGADVNRKSKIKVTPLHLAVEHSSTCLVQFLLRKGADVNCRGPDNKTPIFRACSYHNVAKIKLLLNYGAKINVKDNSGSTPFHQLYYKEREAGQIMLKHMALRFYNGERIEACDLRLLRDHNAAHAYFMNALSRVMMLKNDKFFRNVTFFDVFCMKPSQLLKLVRNNEFIGAFRANYGKHKSFWDDLEIKFEKALMERELLYSAEHFLASIFGEYLPAAALERMATFFIIDALDQMEEEEARKADNSFVHPLIARYQRRGHM
ncbi:hypothetical protein TSAR_007469 [Trichomalopsis sarcophagae]|uniref:Uncharacterized protein n=1 Tax=Trichomalopsis sarcophagae TaxID=543379 RepID=A0A232F5M2_9HYME|nr:hypothetical protein TSAR_007469 [Trichomalopsis sarcophagae]